MTATSRLFGLALAGGLGACTPATPAMPSFAADVQPIFAANCARCHGAGGTLQNEEPPIVGGTINCYLNVYDDLTDCTPVNDALPITCQPGARTCATAPSLAPFFLAYLHPAPGATTVMPPPPADPLNSWELDIVDRWLENPLP
jgi:hypothetical protein